MNTARKALKYGSAGAVTALYTGAVYVTVTKKALKPAESRKVITMSVALIVTTWIVALV